MTAYDFGPGHPLKPERLHRTMALLEALEEYAPIDPGLGDASDVLRVHDASYVDAVAAYRTGGAGLNSALRESGFGPGDNPPFEGMFEASVAYVAGSAAAARAVRDGADLAYGIGGGLHHARRAQASGFCIFNDPAIACHILRERFERVAYVDIDVHHGDGVQWIFYDDPTVLTCSIHQDPRTLYPGTGFVGETGVAHTALNVPLAPNTTGDVWLWAFENGIVPALERFRPEAIVLQMGTDSHFLDPIARLLNTALEWVRAVDLVRCLGKPIVALGGGGYDLTTVPRMWVAACLTLAKKSVPECIPEPLAGEWGVDRFFDERAPGPTGSGREHAEQVVDFIRANHLRAR